MTFYDEERERAAMGWRIAFGVSLIVNIVLGGYLFLTHAGRPAREVTKAQVVDALNGMNAAEVKALVAELDKKWNVPATPAQEIPAPVPAMAAPPAVPAPEAQPQPGAPAVPAIAPVVPGTASQPEPAPGVPGAAPAASAPPGQMRVFCRKVTESLYGTFLAALPEKEAEWLSAYFTRCMVWNMNIQHDVQKGDTIRAIYQMDNGPESMVVPALDFRGAAGKVVRAVRYKAAGDAFPRYFDPNGQEIELRLKDSPIHDWEQITELFGGPRKHHGVDFKAPIGTPVYAPFDGRVVKKNWNWKFNGNCVEVEFPSKGYDGLFLHMERVEDGIEPGKVVKAGQQIGRVGNTGHVTAPHLHYQIDVGKNPTDPLKMDPTYRRKLPEAEMPAFRAAVAPLLKQLDALTCP